MALKTYTITATGQTSNGNSITQPFTLEVHELYYTKAGDIDLMSVHTCVKNGSGDSCPWDQLESIGFGNGRKNYSTTPVMSSSKNSDLAGTLEVDLESIVPGKWS